MNIWFFYLIPTLTVIDVWLVSYPRRHCQFACAITQFLDGDHLAIVQIGIHGNSLDLSLYRGLPRGGCRSHDDWIENRRVDYTVDGRKFRFCNQMRKTNMRRTQIDLRLLFTFSRCIFNPLVRFRTGNFKFNFWIVIIIIKIRWCFFMKIIIEFIRWKIDKFW